MLSIDAYCCKKVNRIEIQQRPHYLVLHEKIDPPGKILLAQTRDAIPKGPIFRGCVKTVQSILIFFLLLDNKMRKISDKLLNTFPEPHTNIDKLKPLKNVKVKQLSKVLL